MDVVFVQAFTLLIYPYLCPSSTAKYEGQAGRKRSIHLYSSLNLGLGRSDSPTSAITYAIFRSDQFAPLKKRIIRCTGYYRHKTMEG
ncbi:hypothetical protein PGT21_034174 [Puccinia graminis f. sp. tritici]|uniref:Secreted protein n=1 Tax=Puccinia graminis f. sp. tritici TaxID=56615 RepID=A0A5B0MNF6_PUCGR|nr:hypothetical protein PGT21_034174 [Puccinia graminis f. sp. tritici]